MAVIMMKLNGKGFSLLEILAVIMLTAAVVFPLLASLTGNMEVNDRVRRRNAASLVTVSALQGFNAAPFSRLDEALKDHVENHEEAYIYFDKDICAAKEAYDIPAGSNVWNVCELVFDLKMANETFAAENFRVFLYYKEDVVAYPPDEDDVPLEVIREMEQADEVLLNITVWLRYDAKHERTLVRSGFMTERPEVGSS